MPGSSVVLPIVVINYGFDTPPLAVSFHFPRLTNGLSVTLHKGHSPSASKSHRLHPETKIGSNPTAVTQGA